MSTYWHHRLDPVSLVSVTEVVLQEDLVLCSRSPCTDDRPSALKL